MKFILPLRSAAALALALSAATLARAQINPGFESGNFTGWTLTSGAQATVVGSVTDYPIDPWTLIEDTSLPYSVNPYRGQFMARLVAGTTKLKTVETALNLSSGSLSNSLNNPFGIADASAISQDLWLIGGMSVVVHWNFLAADPSMSDFAFLTLSGAGNSWVNILSSGDAIGNGNGTGWQTAQITVGTTGLYRLGLGVANFEDNTVPSILYADAISAVPEPGTYGLLGAVFCAGVVAWRRRRTQST